MSDRSGRLRRRLVAALMATVLVSALPATTLGADPDPAAERATRMHEIVEKIQATDHVHPDGSTHSHGGMAALSRDDLAFLGLRHGSGACAGMFEIDDATAGDSCTHGLDVMPRREVGAAKRDNAPATGARATPVPGRADNEAEAEIEAGAEAEPGFTLAATCDPIYEPDACPKPPGWKVPTQIPCYSTGPFVEVMYLYWGTGRFAAMKERIRRSIAWADLTYRVSAQAVQDPGGIAGNRHVRWAMAAGCKLKVTAVKLSDANPGDIGSIKSSLLAQGKILSSTKYIAFRDIGDACYGGIAELVQNSSPLATNPSNQGGSFGMLDAGCTADYDFGSIIAAHELTHTLGAVQYNAPHTTGGHCWDDSGSPGDGADIMCYDDGGVDPSKFYLRCGITIPETFDCGKDDYFNPYPKSGNYLYNHWNTAKNKFLSTAEPPAWDTIPILSVALVGNGTKIAGTATIAATVTAPAGLTIDHVRFRMAGEEVWRDNDAPYDFELDTFPVPNLANVKIEAVAYDQYGMPSLTGSATYVVVNPQVHLDAPAAHLISSPKATWSATATAAGGRTVSKVQLLVFDAVVATDTIKPYGGTINLAPLVGFGGGVGYVEVAARVTDSAGVVRTTAARPMWIGAPFADVVPLDTYNHKVGVPTRLAAFVTPAIGVAISKVEFLVNETLVATDTTAPYAAPWTPGSVGTRNLRVRVTDSAGYVTQGEPHPIGIIATDASVTIDAPTDGQVLDGGMLTVGGSAVAPTGGTVDGLWAVVDGSYETFIPTPSGSVDVDVSFLAPGDHFVRLGATGASPSGQWYLGSGYRHFRVDGPDVAITAPTQGAVVRQTVQVGVSVGDLAGASVYGVELFDGETSIGFDDTAPYAIPWDTLQEPDGTARLTARVGLSSGPSVDSPLRTVTKRNLRAWFTSPLPNATVSGMVAFKGGGRCDTDCVLENSTFRIDGVAVKYDNSLPYGFSWDSTTVAEGPHTYSVTFSTSDARSVSTTAFPFVVNNVP